MNVSPMPDSILSAAQTLANAGLAAPLTQMPGSKGFVMSCPNGFHVNLFPLHGDTGLWFCNSGQHALLPYPGVQSDYPKGEAFAGEFTEENVAALLERVAHWPAAPAVRMFGGA